MRLDMVLASPIDRLPATSTLTIRRLKSLVINTFEDLLNYFPFRYENYSLISSTAPLQVGEKLTIKGRVLEAKNQYTRKARLLQKIRLSDDRGVIEAVWYNQPYLIRLIRPDSLLSVAGEVKNFFKSTVLEAQQYELLRTWADETIHTGRLVPVYPEIRGLSSKTLREKIFYLLKNCLPQEIFPATLLHRYQLISETDAYQQVHFPQNLELAKQARRRLAFDEMTIIQLTSSLIKKDWQKEKVVQPLLIEGKLIGQLIARLPFELTKAQSRCLEEIMSDLVRAMPMNRLLQGEVGSGKTVVAAVAAYAVFLNHYQTLIMAPTEILSFQHFNTLTSLFRETQLKKTPKIVLYTASLKPKSSELASADIIVGTHALIGKKTQFPRVGLIVVDEQHKFGVVQRAQLKKKGINPHLLTMTATPIPRTVVLTMYGELDLSIIDEMPKGRASVKTYLVKNHKRNAAYDWIKKQIKSAGIQVFIICPLIEVSEKETLISVKAAKKEFAYLKNDVFGQYRLGLLHGKMTSKEKNLVMKEFAQKDLDILVTTPVVEVGIDVVNATIIVIEATERFGLAQLHQLRGRVGRGDKPSYCLLFTEKESPTVTKRLRFFTRCHLGLALAEHDLRLRGAGEIYGTQQHGAPNLKIASLTDFDLIHQARAACDYLLDHDILTNCPCLQKRLEKYRISLISRD